MSNHVLLNNNEHKNIKVIQGFDKTYGHDQMCVPVFPIEARHAQAHYPLVFAKDAQDQFQMVALLGLEQGENLFLDNGVWQASYKPLIIEKGPFLIGRSAPTDGDTDTLSIYVDLDDPRIVIDEQNAEHALPVFLPHGGNTDYIDNIANVLSTIHLEQAKHKAFIDACEAHDLIESFVMDIELDGAGTHRLSGFYTINEDRLKALSGEQLKALHDGDYLQTIYMMLASMSQLRQIIAYKKALNARVSI